MGNEHVLKELLGKTITGVVTKRAAGFTPPQHQVFLLFSDGTYYEFYTVQGSIALAGGIDHGGLEEVKHYMKDYMRLEAAFTLPDEP